MKFSELIKKWEDGWRGTALDSCDEEWDFTKDYIENPEGVTVITNDEEEWTIKEEEEKENKNNITVNITATITNKDEIEKLVAKLQEELANIKVNFTLS